MKNLLKIGLLALLLVATPVSAQIVPAQNQIIPSAYFGAGVLISTSTSPTHKITAVATSTLFAPGTFAPFPFTPTTFGSTAANSTSTLIGFLQGIYSLASSTIGNGTQTGGLTVSGGATTTGVGLFNSNVILGSSATPVVTEALNISATPTFQINSSSAAASALFYRFSANANPARIFFLKTRGVSETDYAAVNATDQLGSFSFAGGNGTEAAEGAIINAYAAETQTGTNYTATNLGLWTSPGGTTAPAQRLTVSSNGDIGIGATDPFNRLTVAATTTNVTTALNADFRSVRAAIVSNNLIGGIGFRSNDTNLTAPGLTVGSIYTVANQTHTAATQGTDMVFTTTATGGTATNTEKMRITGAGNVGIGTTSPDAPLTFSQTLGSKIHLFSNATQQYGFGTASGVLRLFSGTGGIAFGNQDGSATFTERVRIGSTGNLGVGTTTPGTLLSLGNTGANTINLSETATSTFGSGINLRTGCFAVNGVCITGGGGISSVSGTYPVVSSGGSTPAISLAFGTTTSNTWAGTQTFTNAPVLTSLATPAGTFLAVDASGNVIATTTPSGGGSTVTPYSVTGGVSSDEYTELTTINVTSGDVVMFWAATNKNSGCSGSTIGINLVYKVGGWPATTTQGIAKNSAGGGDACSVAAQGTFTATTTDTIKIAITRNGVVGADASSIMAQLIE